MAIEPVTANSADFSFELGEHPGADLRVTAFEGTEGLDDLYAFRVRLCGRGFDADPTELLGQQAALRLHGEGRTRTIHGILWRFAYVGEGGGLAHYEAELAPLHRILTRRVQSRVFEPTRCPDMTVAGIVRRVFAEAGIDEQLFHFALQNEYPQPDFVAQYRESDWDLVNRLLEHEGIHYFFEQRDDGYRMVISDQPASFRPDTDPQLPFRTPNGLVAEQEYVFAIRDQRHTRFGAVTLDDFTFRDPGQDLKAEAHSGNQTALRFSDYPARYQVKSEGKRYAAIRMQEQLAGRATLALQATARGLQPGTCLQLAEHAISDLNADYLVTQLLHRGTQPQSGEEEAGGEEGTRYQVDVSVIPAAVRYRPARHTPRPTVAGSQTALVVGPESEEIHTDEYGRVRVQFHWDQDGTHGENSSAWIRVSQGLAGGGYGMMFLPRVGQEVIVDFLEGNPDCPIVTGRVYNKDHMPPYALPEHKNRSTIKTRSTTGGGGSNELRFDDTKDAEQVLLYGQRDLHLRAGNDRHESIGNDRHLEVGRDRFEQVTRDVHSSIGRHQTEHVAGDHARQVDGMVSLQVTGTRSLTVTGDVIEDCQSSFRQTVTNTAALSADKISLEATSCLELKCGGSTIVLTPGAIFINGGPTVHINSGPGPAVAPPTAAATTPTAPTAPVPAEDVTHGLDTRYGAGGSVQQQPVTPPAEELPDEPATSWIEIELVDEDEQPVPGARFELRLPDGSIREGRLNANGLARVSGIEPGTCEICFPDLDAECWERI